MVKIIIEDIKSNNKKKEIIPKKVATHISTPIQTPEKIIDKVLHNKKQRLQRTPQIKMRTIALHKPILIILVLSIIVGMVYWGGNIFQKADVIIISKHQPITYTNEQFLASKDQSVNAVDFEIMITSDNKSENIILTESKDASIKATGSVTLYNEFSTTPQKLVAGTFLSDNSGKTYKTDSAITIPGYKKDANKKITPGSIVVNITSFLAGDSYNGTPTDFYVNSFKGTTKYNKIYGKLNSPLVGGAVGLIYTLDDLNKTNIDNIAQTSFKDDLIKQVQAQVPPGYILYPNALTFSYKIGDNVLSKTPNAEVIIEGVLSVVLIKEKSLIDNIIKISLPDIKGDELKEIKISDLSKLSFDFTNKAELITKDMNSVSFSLSGSVDAIWNPDIELLKTKLIGIRKDNALSIFRQDPGISSALLKIFPPWQKYIPSNLSKINIIIK